MLPKLGEMLEGLQIDLRTKFGPLSALKLKLRRCQKIFVLGGGDPQTGSSIRKIIRSILYVPAIVRYGEETKSISGIVKKKA